MKLTRVPEIWNARWFAQVWDQLLGDSATLAGHIVAADPHTQYATDTDLTTHVGATDPHPDLIDDLTAATTVALTDKVVVSQTGTNKAATVQQVHDALPIVYYVPASVTKNTGGTVAGDVTGVRTMLDGSIYEVAEVTGAPGFDIEFTFASVVRTPAEIVLRLWYEGSISHDVHVEIYNYVTPGWNTVHVVADKEDYEVIVLPIPSFANYLSAGAVKVRLYHETAGSTAHDIRFDYVALRAL